MKLILKSLTLSDTIKRYIEINQFYNNLLREKYHIIPPHMFDKNKIL